VPLGTVRPDLDPRLVATVERAMARQPADRFASAADMAAALDGPPPAAPAAPAATTLDERPGGTLIMPSGERPVAAPPAPVMPPPPRRARPVRRSRPAPWSSRKGLGWALAILAAVALVLLLTATSGPSIDALARQAASTTVAPTTPTTRAPATTVPTTTAPAQQSLSQVLRALADHLKPSDGARAGDLASGLRQVANDLDAGSPAAAGHATGLIISAAAWQQTGQLSASALTSAVQLLQSVPGVQAVAATQSPAVVTTVAPRAATGGPAGATAPTAGGGKSKGKGKAGD
jgi:serine/threonine-protein kinase